MTGHCQEPSFKEGNRLPFVVHMLEGTCLAGHWYDCGLVVCNGRKGCQCNVNTMPTITTY